ncbi:amidase [Dacryopinax primogenitus]|uniref:amidase n=1 Tax=Dacryopinax primogenitus (strain DJM 731) TaxID=1858805 RepID=M5FNI1_DACPD|nr:amidase [Dacryopinax primogenitus]EJT97485.1 amidase [Dacryopinax primogenitus]
MSVNLVEATGSPVYMEQVHAIKQRRDSQIPASLRLPKEVIDSAPLDVTSIPASCGLLTDKELAITELDATSICQKIAAREITAVETVTAFGKRAIIAHQLVNCLTDIFLDEGISRAKELDEYYEREGKVVGPLHGLPISIKDHVPLKGRWASAGFLATVEVSQDDCLMTSTLRNLGAVFYVKTNQPQSIMHLETNSMYGRTLNPWNTSLTPGGSSGGEGALIAMKGSCIGVGTDIGGSIRGPAANSGIYGMRPSSKTLPMKGYLAFQFGADGVLPSTGPMCRSARDIDLFIRNVLASKPSLIDVSLVPVVWDVPTSFEKKLRVGIMEHDSVVLPHPPILRALAAAKAKLAASGLVEVVNYKPFRHDLGYDIIRELYFEDGGKIVRDLLSQTGERMLPLTEWVISPPYTKDHDATSLRALRTQRDEYRDAYSDYWNQTGCDVVLCPPFPGTANPHDTAKYWSYTAIWNILDYPGIVFPSGARLNPSVDVLESRTHFLSDADKLNEELYHATKMVGAPVSFQLVARRFNDCLLVAAQKVIEDILKAE